MDKLTNMFKILSDETRLRILVSLYHRELCVCQLQGILEETQPKISKHLSKLRDMGFVKDERREQFIYYFLVKDNEILNYNLRTIIENVKEYKKIGEDLERLKDADKFREMKINQDKMN